MDDPKKRATPFPDELQLDEPILHFKINKYTRCIFYHVQRGILRKCYNNHKEIKKAPVLIVEDRRILGIDLDHTNNYLFYYVKNNITLMDLNTMTKLTVYKTEEIITFMNYDFVELYLGSKHRKFYISTLTQSNHAIKVIILSLTGVEELSIPAKDKVVGVMNLETSYHVYTVKESFSYILKTQSIGTVGLF
ncbi:hypothetical protein RF11_06438 [Thelohanellus kitauei]|uniref:Uncharacterized protein n=1 Tax=Thelohanellus kitauei TaxID=669202 RepID=A0A0C2MZ79_THEKT|nr:hypothetical protein RF11_06438 [Thelohanellus kitauei]